MSTSWQQSHDLSFAKERNFQQNDVAEHEHL